MAGRLDDDGGDLAELHEINVTPFIDVMLVLLIIFMVAAPLATVEVKVDLPSSTAEPAVKPPKPLYLTVKENKTLAVGETITDADELAAALDATSGGDKETRIFLRADRSVDYGSLMAVMDSLRAAGYLKVALVGLESGR